MKIQTFIFNWKRYSRIVDLTSRLIPNSVVINSDEEYTQENWINLGESAYFTTKFLKALELFNSDILLHIQADAFYNHWISFANDAVQDYAKYKWGVYAPDIDYTPFKSDKIDKEILTDNRRIVSHTDCTAWMIHKDVINYFLSLNIDISDNKYGWGIDMIMIGISNFLNLPVIRNYNHKIYHPRITNYDHNIAREMCSNMISKLPIHIKSLVPVI